MKNISADSTDKSKTGLRMRFILLSSACLTLGMAVSSDALAQTRIEQMVVTATKRSQQLQDVPASISAFSSEGLESRQLRTVEDISRATPNIGFNVSAAVQPNLTIRGVGIQGGVSPVQEGTVALHLDGIYQPRVQGLNQFMSDLESVEVLRGPQGTLYGRNANAGVINLITAKPTDTFEGKATLFGGSFERYGAKGYVSGPVANGISVRLSGMFDRNAGFGRNLVNNDRVNGERSWGARLAVRLKPADSVTIDLALARFFSHTSPVYYIRSDPLRGPTQNYTRIQTTGADVRYTLAPWKVYNGYESDVNTRANLGSALISWEITPDITLKSVTGWQHVVTKTLQDQDGMPVNYLNGTTPANSHTFSQEFNLSAKLWDRLDAVLGLYYLRDINGGGNINPMPLGNPVGTNMNQVTWNFLDQDIESKAAFLDVTFNVFDNLRLLGGVRRTFDDRKSIQTMQLVYVNGVQSQGFPTIIGSTRLPAGCLNLRVPDLNFTSTTGKLGIQYDLTPDIMAYVSWQNGFKTGGYSATVCNNSFLPERIYSWEGGIKGTYFDNRLTLNISYFDYRYSNMQLSRTINISPTVITTITDNASSASLRGAEIEAVAYFSDALSADLGIGILDGKYGPFQARNGAVPGNPIVDLTGKKLPNAPSLSINLGVEYLTQCAGVGEIKLRGEYRYSSLIYYTSFNEDIAKQDPYSVFSAFVTLTPEFNENLSFQFYVKNLLNKAYVTSGTSSGIMFLGRGNWAPPRTFGAELTAKF